MFRKGCSRTPLPSSCGKQLATLRTVTAQQTNPSPPSVPSLKSLQMPGSQGWDDQWVACNVSLGREREGEGMGGAAWWRFDCGLVDAGGAPFAEHDAHHCSKSFLGPQCVLQREGEGTCK